MQCSRCGAPVQPGMAFCPNCGTPYASAQNAPIPPTQYAGPSSFDQGAQPYNAGQAYTPPADPYAPQAPAPYGTPGGYGTPPPPPNAYNVQSPYGTPPPPPSYGAPYAPTPGAFAPQPQPPRKKGPNVGLIIGVVALLLVLIVGGVLALRGLNHPGGQTNTNTPTTGTTTTPGVTTTATNNQTPGPSGSPIDPGAAAIITNVQTATGIDANLLPTHVTNQFKVGAVVYVTYNLHLTQSGYVEAKVYVDGVFGTQTSLQVTVGKYDHGYFNITYKRASAGAFELYWCLQSNCSDGKLAAVASFTVS
jgi:zinc-ribbon domain